MYYKNIFQNSNLDWKTIYMLPRIVTKDSRLHSLGPIKNFSSNQTLSFPSLTPQSPILGHIDLSDDYLSINHVILIYNFYIYNSRNRILTLTI